MLSRPNLITLACGAAIAFIVAGWLYLGNLSNDTEYDTESMRVSGSHVAPPPAAASAAKAHAAAPSAEEKTLKIWNWPDYVPDGLLEEFERRTGIKVEYRTFKTNEEIMSLLEKGQIDADIIVPSSPYAGLLIQKGLLRQLDPWQLANLKYLDPQIAEHLAKVDPSGPHLVPWAWGFTTVGINRNKVEAALGQVPMPTNAWDQVFNPAYTSRLRQCGIGFLDAPSELIPAAAQYAGKPAYSNLPQDHEAGAKVIASVRGDVKVLSTDLIEPLSSGQLCAVVGWSGDLTSSRP